MLYDHDCAASSPAVETAPLAMIALKPAGPAVTVDQSSCFHSARITVLLSSGTVNAGVDMFCADGLSWVVTLPTVRPSRRNAAVCASVSAFATPPVNVTVGDDSTPVIIRPKSFWLPASITVE